MVIRICIIIILSLFIPRLLPAQNPLIQGEYDRVPIKTFIMAIEDQTGLRFVYKSEWFADLSITARGDSLDLIKILEEHCASMNLYVNYHSSGIIFITRDRPLIHTLPDYKNGVEETPDDDVRQAESTLTESERLYTEGRRETVISTLTVGSGTDLHDGNAAIINGRVRDVQTGESLIGATVYIQEISRGFVSDINGHFVLTLPPGTYTAQFNCMGMEEMNYKLDILSSGTLDIEMKSKLYPIDEITVKSGIHDNVRGLEMGFAKLSIKDIKEIPVVMGEKDVLKVMQMLPGVQNVGEGTAGLYVRGSSADQNLFILNNIPVYNASHLFGFFSAFNPDIIRDFSIYKSNLPARYGGKLASVIEIGTRQGSNKAYTARGGISPVTAHAAVEGPILRDRHSFVFSARTTYSDWIINRIRNPEFHHSTAGFRDIFGGVNLKMNNRNLVKVSGYYSFDRISLASQDVHQNGNAGASINWWHQLSPTLSSNATLLYSRYRFLEENYNVPLESYRHQYRMGHNEGRVDFIWIPSLKHKLSFGGNMIFYNLDRGNVFALGPESSRMPIQLGSEYGLENALYVSDEYRVMERLTLNLGLRYSFYNSLGPATVHLYKPGDPVNPEFISDSLHFRPGKSVRSYSGPEARASLNFLTGSNSSLKASYNKTRQYLYMLSNSIAVSPVDQWKLSDYHVEPASADQISLGFYKDMPGSNLKFSGEVYYKWIENIVDYRDGASFILSPHVETEVLQGIQRAYGVEFLLKKDAGKFNGWLSFTWSRSFIKIDGENTWERINNGHWYPANYDIPVSLNAWTSYRLNRRLSFSGNLVYHTGRPATYPVSQFQMDGRHFISYSARNEYRIPDYFRLDLSFNLEGNLKARKLAHSFWMLNIYNLTGRANAYSVFFKFEEEDLQAYKLSIFSQPIITLSWNFKFGNYESD